MSYHSNHVGHYDESRRVSRKNRRNEHDTSDFRDTDTSLHSVCTSVNAPSIIELENLREVPNDSEYPLSSYRSEVSTKGRNSRMNRSISSRRGDNSIVKSPAYKPHPSKKWRNRPKTTVYVSVVFLKVGEIETIKEYFEADIYIQAKWREPALDNNKEEITDFEQYWNPELSIQNIFSDPTEQLWHDVRYSGKGEAFVYEMRRVKGKFNETMELNDFPFDVQCISLVLSTDLTEDSVEFVEDTQELSSIYVDCFSDSQEWELHNFVELESFSISSQFTHARKNFPGILATCCVSRRAGFFSWNILVVVNLLSIFAFSTFAVKPELTPNRLQLSFILMLSAISFRFVANQNIPKVSYLTLLDRYLLTTLIFVAAVTFWHAVVSRFQYDTVLQHDVDFWAFVILAVGYFCFQVVFVLWMIIKKRRKVRQIQTREKKYKYKARGILGNMWGSLRKEFAGASAFMGFTEKPSIHNRPR
ncbi:hypothetical protein ACF0H5_024369 [Mactra antiquata]